MDAESFKEAVAPLLKEQGFKRSGTTWRREQDESIAVFNVQKSQWGDGEFYLNVGTYLRALGNDASPKEYNCHVRVRLKLNDPAIVVAAAMDWFKARATLHTASKLAESDSKKGLVVKELRDTTTT